jgi:hypothetical protein
MPSGAHVVHVTVTSFFLRRETPRGSSVSTAIAHLAEWIVTNLADLRAADVGRHARGAEMIAIDERHGDALAYSHLLCWPLKRYVIRAVAKFIVGTPSEW